ncbi:MAG: hypothetical protein OYH77_06210 [Pseudomonadota bacterium]|nr:hypothetical protein [Pseudomonadota bacterium]
MDAGSSAGLTKLEKTQRAEIKKLEKWLIELGAEVYKMRQEMADIRDQHSQMLAVIGEMRSLMHSQDTAEPHELYEDPTGHGQESFEQQLEEFNRSLTYRKRLSH